jgi:hypothetical protein
VLPKILDDHFSLSSIAAFFLLISGHFGHKEFEILPRFIYLFFTPRRDVEELHTRLKERDGWMSDWHLKHQ